MIDISLYRVRIGSFSQFSCRKLSFSSRTRFRHSYGSNFSLWKLLTKLIIIIPTILSFCESLSTKIVTVCTNLSKYQNDVIFSFVTQISTGNFYARYTNGNISNPKGLKMCHLNIRSIKNKMSEVKRVIADNKPHVLGCSESEIKSNLQKGQLSHLKIPGYEMLLPRSWDLHGYARVVVYVKKSLSFERINDLEDDHLQTIWIKCGFKNAKSGFVCNGYREYTSNIGTSINNQEEKMLTFLNQWECAINFGNPAEPNDVFILCDMNLDCYQDKWKNQNYHLYYLSKIVLRFCNENNMDQLVKGVTRAQYNAVANRTQSSCLDHIYTNVSYKCSPPLVISFGDSDHDLVSFTRLSKPPPDVSRTIRKRSYKTFDKEQFLYDLAEVDWTDVLVCPDVDTAAELFSLKFSSVLDWHAPWIVFQHRKFYKPWITANTIELMKERDRLKKVAINLSQQNSSLGASAEEKDAWRHFKVLRNKINNLKKNEENTFKKQVLAECKDDAKQTWNSIKGFMDWKSADSPHQLVVDNKLYRKSSEVAKLLNEFFINKVNCLRSKFKDQHINLDGCYMAMSSKSCSLSLSFVTVSKVEKLLRNLKPSKATAVDGLDAYSLKVASNIVAVPIHHLISLSLMQQRVPALWKHAKILPLHKKGNVLETKSYRPISILSPVSKILERVIYNQLYSYFSENKLFHENAMGFRKHRSTLTAMLQMYDRWTRGAGQGKISGVVLLDLSAAFDLVKPSILLKKLEVYGVKSDLIKWLECYLSNRKQAVWVDHILSDWLDVEIGVPQGSILGPLLFIIFANDLPYLLSCCLDQYADDSTLTSVKSSIAEINVDLAENCQIVSDWMHENQLCLNIDKTHLMVCGTSQKLSRVKRSQAVNVTMDGVQLLESTDNSEKILGVHIQPNLKWKTHCFELQARLKSRLAGLRKVRNILSLQKRKIVAQAIFQSVLSYCIALWGGASKGDIEDLQVLQNKAARFVLCDSWRLSRQEMYKKLGWMTVYQLVVFHRIMAVYQIRRTGEPEYLSNLLSNDNNRGSLIVPHTGLTLVKNSFVFHGGELWNSVPPDIRHIHSVSMFKNKLKTWIFSDVGLFKC